MKDKEFEEEYRQRLQAQCLKELQGLLATFEAMEQAPVIGSEEYRANTKGYQARVDEASALLHKAEHIAMITLPQEIATVLGLIDDQHSRVWRIGKYREPKLS